MSDITSQINDIIELAASKPEQAAACLSRIGEVLLAQDKLIQNLLYRVDQLETRMAYVDPHRGC